MRKSTKDELSCVLLAVLSATISLLFLGYINEAQFMAISLCLSIFVYFAMSLSFSLIRIEQSLHKRKIKRVKRVKKVLKDQFKLPEIYMKQPQAMRSFVAGVLYTDAQKFEYDGMLLQAEILRHVAKELLLHREKFP